MTFSLSECLATMTQFGNTSEITTNVSTYFSIHLSKKQKKGKCFGKKQKQNYGNQLLINVPNPVLLGYQR
jgi:hypothetical protein